MPPQQRQEPLDLAHFLNAMPLCEDYSVLKTTGKILLLQDYREIPAALARLQ